MNTKMRLAAVAVTLSLLAIVASPILAGTSIEVLISEGTTLGGTELAKGTYKLLYKKNGSKDTFVVQMFKGGKKVATAEGHREKRDERHASGLAYRAGSNGSREIAEIRLGTKSVIVIDG